MRERLAQLRIQAIDLLNVGGLGIRLMLQGDIPAEEEHRVFDTLIGRTWHNFVASAVTFVDHTRTLIVGE